MKPMSDTVYYSYLESPLGKLLATSDGECLSGLYFPCHQDRHRPSAEWRRDDACFAEVRRQLREYFAGKRHKFDVPLRMKGSQFERRVWSALCKVAHGTTVSYRDIARRIGQPTACRAVGLANGRNPIPIIVPCHRVIGADGSLTGYGGGLETKRWLLALEGVEPPAPKWRKSLAAAR
jgi:methylated-DNA-[protein]-cysteine S-methyltransferase